MKMYREHTVRQELTGIVATFNHTVGTDVFLVCSDCLEEFTPGDIFLVGEHDESLYAAHIKCLVVEG